jgi:AbrB family transcriptional regulator (stage V sporulation protein T)
LVNTKTGVDFLKSTGVIRHIDELGRIVIPKEIRRNLGIRDGENLEIFIDEDKIILQKQMMISRVSSIAESIINIIGSIYNIDIAISDRDNIVAGVNGLGSIIGEKLTSFATKLMDKREIYSSLASEDISFSYTTQTGYFYIMPVIIEADVAGLIIIRSYQPIKEEEKNISRVIKEIIAKRLSIS